MAAVLALGMARGFFRGFAKTLLSMLSLVLVIVSSVWLTPAISRFMADSMNVQAFFTEHTQSLVDAYIAASLQGTGAGNVTSGGNVQQLLLSLIASALNDGDLRMVVTKKIVGFAIALTAGLICFVLMSLFWTVISRIVLRVFRWKGLRAVDRILGLAFGGFRALVIVCLAFALISLFSNTPLCASLLSEIRRNELLMMIFEINPIAKFLPGLFASVAAQL